MGPVLITEGDAEKTQSDKDQADRSLLALKFRRSGRSINLDVDSKWDGKTGQGVNDLEAQGMGISCEWIGARREDLGKLQSWLSYLSTLVTHWNPLGTL